MATEDYLPLNLVGGGQMNPEPDEVAKRVENGEFDFELDNLIERYKANGLDDKDIIEGLEYAIGVLKNPVEDEDGE